MEWNGDIRDKNCKSGLAALSAFTGTTSVTKSVENLVTKSGYSIWGTGQLSEKNLGCLNG